MAGFEFCFLFWSSSKAFLYFPPSLLLSKTIPKLWAFFEYFRSKILIKISTLKNNLSGALRIFSFPTRISLSSSPILLPALLKSHLLRRKRKKTALGKKGNKGTIAQLLALKLDQKRFPEFSFPLLSSPLLFSLLFFFLSFSSFLSQHFFFHFPPLKM